MITAVLMSLWLAEPTQWETVRLHSGHTLRGELLREKDDSIVLDLGFNVVVIAKKQIAARGAGDAEPAVASRQTFGETSDLYATADLPPTDIKELVERFGEGVVMVKTPSGLGSGFIIDAAGHCITNAHVIERETRISVEMYVKSGNSLVERTIDNVAIVALSPFLDLALIKIPPRKETTFKRVYLGHHEEVRQGDSAFAIGNPEGLSRSVSEGIISNRARSIAGQIYLQTTTQINPGNSGGPLFNNRGQVIGVTNMKRTFSEGLGFAIPVNQVKEFLANRDAYAYNKDQPNTGFHYFDPPRRQAPLPAEGK